MLFAFLVFSSIFTAYLSCVWNTRNATNIFVKMYLLLLAVYFGYNAFVHPIFQSIL